jgi:hypothetical protein
VCNACSPHRITIPYQFIVSPPTATGSSERPRPDSHITEGASVFADRNGGMKVRLCNPCVPDPNTIPPQQQPRGESWRREAPPTYYMNAGNRPYSLDEEAINNMEREAGTLAGQREVSGARARGMSAASGLSYSDRRQGRADQLYSQRYGGGVSVLSTIGKRYILTPVKDFRRCPGPISSRSQLETPSFAFVTTSSRCPVALLPAICKSKSWSC